MDQNNLDNSDNSAPDIQNETQQQAPIEQPTTKKSRNIILAVLLVLSLISAGAIYMFNKNQDDVIEPVVSTSEILDDESAELEGLKFTEDTEQRPGVEVYESATGRYYLLENTQEYTYVAQYEPASSDIYTAKQVVGLFVKKALEDGYTIYNEENADLAKYIADNNQTRVVKEEKLCSISATESQEGSGVLYRSCVDTNELKNEASRLKVFYDSYEASADYKNSEYRGPYIIEVDEINAKDSTIAGYQYLYGGIGGFGGGANAPFVRQAESDWVFFIGRQDITNCDEYNTELFQKALADETCHSANNEQKTVKEYYNL